MQDTYKMAGFLAGKLAWRFLYILCLSYFLYIRMSLLHFAIGCYICVKPLACAPALF